MKSRKISKSRYVRGLQCLKLLWLSVNEPESEELKPDLLAQHRFDTGHKVGQLAQDHFPGGILLENTKNFDDWLGATSAAIERGEKTIFEAAFTNELAFVAVDILEHENGQWNIIEVKSATSVKDTYLHDLAIQYWLLSMLGLKVGKAEIMHINRDCEFPKLESLFVRVDVTDAVRELSRNLADDAGRLSQMLAGHCPTVETGSQCKSPYRCPFYERCHGNLPEHHISTLYRISPERVAELQINCIEEVHHLVDEVQLSEIQNRQVASVKIDDIIVEKDLKEDLNQINYPVAFLDFETIAPAVPLWSGCRPYQPVAVQMSCHLLQESGAIEHFEWIIKSPDDPRNEMSKAIIESCSKAATVVAYNAPFEKRCIRDIADYVGGTTASKLEEINTKFVDLLPIVRNNVYHPNFKGSFSIKSVLPSLVKDLSYSDLDVSDGMTASIRLEQFASGSDRGWSETKHHLLEYCCLDTLAMVRLFGVLASLPCRSNIDKGSITP